MTKDEALNMADIIKGYDAWRRHKVAELEGSDYHLSASHYLDELAKQRAIDTVEELRELLTNEDSFDLTLDQVILRAREILGLA